jgi:hypothetical protein
VAMEDLPVPAENERDSGSSALRQTFFLFFLRVCVASSCSETHSNDSFLNSNLETSTSARLIASAIEEIQTI